MAFLTISFCFSVSLFDVSSCLKVSVKEYFEVQQSKSSVWCINFDVESWLKHDLDKETSFKGSNMPYFVPLDQPHGHHIRINSEPLIFRLHWILKGGHWPGPEVVMCFLFTPSECDTSEGQAADRSAKLTVCSMCQRLCTSRTIRENWAVISFEWPPKKKCIPSFIALN